MKRFNYTGRKRILKTDVHVQIFHEENRVPKFNIVLDLDDYGLPDEALVTVEAYQAARWMRFHIGRVGLITIDRDINLDDFDDIHNLRFRVKIVEEETGKLLAMAVGVAPFTEGEEVSENQTSILPVRSVDLQEYGVCWKLEYDEQDVALLVEKDLGGKEQVVRSKIFKSLILPSAMREILNHLISLKDWDDELSDTSYWQTKWLIFVKNLGGGLPNHESDADNADWVDEAVRRLVNKLGGREEFVTTFEERVW